jgi:hypothetical protein
MRLRAIDIERNYPYHVGMLKKVSALLFVILIQTVTTVSAQTPDPTSSPAATAAATSAPTSAATATPVASVTTAPSATVKASTNPTAVVTAKPVVAAVKKVVKASPSPSVFDPTSMPLASVAPATSAQVQSYTVEKRSVTGPGLLMSIGVVLTILLAAGGGVFILKKNPKVFKKA